MVAGKDHLTVPVASTSFGTHKVVGAIFFINMRSLNPDRLLCDIYSSVHNNLIGAGNDLIFLQVIFPYFDYPVPLIALFPSIGRIVVDYIGFSVVVKKERRIDTAKIQFLYFTPSLEGIFGFYYHIPNVAGKLSRDHIKGIVVGVVFDCRCVDPCTDAGIMYFQL